MKFFNWAGTMWKGQITFEPPMLFTVGFLIAFLFGGITGIILASPPLDFAVSDSYFAASRSLTQTLTPPAQPISRQDNPD